MDWVRAGMVHWWNHFPPTSVSSGWVPAPTPYRSWVHCRLFFLLQEVFSRYFGFPLSSKATFPNFNLIWRKSYSFLCMFLQLNSIDFENNPELKKLQFLAPGPKMAGLAKGTLQPKKEFNIKPGKIWKKSLTTSISSVIVMKVFCKVLVFWSDILSHQTWIVRIGEVWPPVWVWLLLHFGEVSLMVHSALSNQEQGNHDR